MIPAYSVQSVNTSHSREEQLTLELLEAINERNDLSQRNLAKQLGVALGLANSYLKRCVRKGYVKVTQVPANRYLYYLTPVGMAEKSRLTARYLSTSLIFYRQASDSCEAIYKQCVANGYKRILLWGDSELAEIAFLRALENGIDVMGLYDAGSRRTRFFTKPVWRDDSPHLDEHDAVLLTDLEEPLVAYRRLSARMNEKNIFVPSVLGISEFQVETGATASE